MVRRMKMAAVSTATLLLLCSLVSSTVSQEKCNLRAEVGQNITFPLMHKLEPSDRLKWQHDGKARVHWRATKIITGSKEDTTEDGSLKLTNLQKSNKGTYKVQVHDQAGKSKLERSTILCVFEKIPKPAVSTTCIGFDVIFTCNIGTHQPEQAQDFSFKWLKSKKVMESEKTPTLKRRFEQVAADLFQCQVSNSVNDEISQPVKQTCKKIPPPAEADSIFPEKLFGFEFWIMATVLGGGGGLVLLLIVITIVCFTRARRRRRHQFKEGEELRLEWANQQQQQQQQQQHNPPHRHQQPGHTGPRQHRCNPSRDPQHPRGSDPAGTNPRHPRPRPKTPAQGSNAADKGKEGQRPPLPQPRKENPRAVPRTHKV